ncbi:hypothetical protein Naga_102764g1, partial [Nannochloropsis gaditana]
MWRQVIDDPAAYLESSEPPSFFIQEKIQGKHLIFPPSHRLSRLVSAGMKEQPQVKVWQLSTADYELEILAHYQEGTLSLGILIPLLPPIA